jgi:hypothetical protein
LLRLASTKKNKAEAKKMKDRVQDIKDRGIRRNLNGFAAICASWDLPQEVQFPRASYDEIIQWPVAAVQQYPALSELRLIALNGSYPTKFLALLDEFLDAVPEKHRKQPVCGQLRAASAEARAAYNFCVEHNLLIPMVRFAGGLAHSSVGLKDSPHFPAMVYHEVSAGVLCDRN